jgi:hypothetical protein
LMIILLIRLCTVNFTKGDNEKVLRVSVCRNHTQDKARRGKVPLCCGSSKM